MSAIAWLLIMIGIGAVIEGYHGKAVWTSIGNLFSGQGAGSSTKQ